MEAAGDQVGFCRHLGHEQHQQKPLWPLGGLPDPCSLPTAPSSITALLDALKLLQRACLFPAPFLGADCESEAHHSFNKG